jgi:hypothetical protein
MIKSFRGLLTDGDKNKIRLSTKDGLTGYKVVKFQLIAKLPGAQSQESVCKIFTVDPAAIDATINFNDPTLLGVAYYRDNNNEIYPTSSDIIFDHTVINQDIFITHVDVAVGQQVNYYIELEQVKLSKDEAAVATLKDMRGRE